MTAMRSLKQPNKVRYKQSTPLSGSVQINKKREEHI